MSRTFDAGEIATLAARTCQVLGANVVALDQQRHAIALQYLDMVIAEIVGSDSRPWEAAGPQAVALSAATESYNITSLLSDPLQFVHHAWIRDANGNDTPLPLISRNEYDVIADKDAAGIPDRLFIDHGRALAYPWPLIAATGSTLYLDGFGYGPDVTKSKGSIPHKLSDAWQLNLHYRLALVIGDGPLIKSPAGDRDRWEKRVADSDKTLSSYTARGSRTTRFVRPYMP